MIRYSAKKQACHQIALKILPSDGEVLKYIHQSPFLKMVRVNVLHTRLALQIDIYK